MVFPENEMIYGHSFDVPTDDDWVVPIGRAVVREGSDVTITFSMRSGGRWRLPNFLPSTGFPPR